MTLWFAAYHAWCDARADALYLELFARQSRPGWDSFGDEVTKFDVPVIAALYVRSGGPYFGLDNVDPWDEERDARQYKGPHPVIAHPPCQRWGKMYAGRPSTIAKTGVRHKLGDDGGCFKHAIWAARTFGGVVEHPMGSKAWPTFGIDVPPKEGGWVPTNDGHGGWTCCVEQKPYGHYARKPTMLVVYGIDRKELPELEWGMTEWIIPQDILEKYGEKRARKAGEMAFRGGGRDSPVRIDTPPGFKELLLRIAALCSSRSKNGISDDDEIEAFIREIT